MTPSQLRTSVTFKRRRASMLALPDLHRSGKAHGRVCFAYPAGITTPQLGGALTSFAELWTAWLALIRKNGMIHLTSDLRGLRKRSVFDGSRPYQRADPHDELYPRLRNNVCW